METGLLNILWDRTHPQPETKDVLLERVKARYAAALEIDPITTEQVTDQLIGSKVWVWRNLTFRTLQQLALRLFIIQQGFD